MAKQSEKNMMSQLAESSEELSAAGSFFENNKRPIQMIGIVLSLLLVGYLGFQIYQSQVVEPEKQAAREATFMEETLFDQMATQFGFSADSTALVLHGGVWNGNKMSGVLKAIKKYDGTQTADRMRYIAGACYLHIGKFDSAIIHLKAFDAHGSKQIDSRRYTMLGNAYAEKKQTKEAMDAYVKAYDVNANDAMFAPEALFVCGRYAAATNNTKAAVDYFKKLKTEFPNSSNVLNGEVDKRLAMLGEL
jgi:predicted negative regulator of RcsB-dependent stress response